MQIYSRPEHFAQFLKIMEEHHPSTIEPPERALCCRLISGQYKSCGNVVNLKVEVLDVADFQRHGCLANPGPGTCQPHTHNISGTLHCNPETGKATLNINLLGLVANDAIQWPLSSPPRTTEPVKGSWNGSNQLGAKEMPYSVYSAPVSPPSLPQDVPPPLLDFTQEQLMTDILNMDMDPQKEEFNSHIPYSDSPPVSLPAPLPSPQGSNLSHLQPSSQETGNNCPLVNNKNSFPVSSQQLYNNQTGKSPSDMPGLPSSPTAQPCLLQPKLERSDSLCSEYTTESLKNEFVNFTELPCGGDLNVDPLEDTDNSAPPSHESSPNLFSPSHSSIQNTSQQQEKQGSYLTKSLFEPKHQTKSNQNDAFDSLFASTVASPKTTSSPTLFSNGSSGFSLTLQPSPKPYLLSHVGSPQALLTSSSSPSSTTSSSETQDTPLTLLASPKSRNRRNSSFDETKPHVCPQCAARFTTKSNLGQHAKIHLAVKPFICEICNHGFTRAAHYESHVAKHKGLKTHR